MHGISHLLSHHYHGPDNGGDTRNSISSSASSDIKNQDTKFLQELLNHNDQQQQQDSNRLYLHERHVSRGSVSSAYSYGSSSYGSSYGSNSSNHQQSVYHTVHGNIHHPFHHYHHYHQQYHHRAASTGKASPTSPSPTNEHEKQHHHHSIQEMIRHFGRRLGHIRRQSESHESPKKRGEDFRNRSQSLDGGARHCPSIGPQETDCETTYRIYESILRQGNASECDRISMTSALSISPNPR